MPPRRQSPFPSDDYLENGKILGKTLVPNTFLLFYRMQEERSYSAATLNAGTGNEWVVSGGWNGERKSSVERTSDGRNFETFRQSMPIALDNHCLVSLDEDGGDLFVTGGWDGDVNAERMG